MPSPSAAFSINGGSSLVKAAVSAAGAVSCVLDSLDGVRQVDWSIAGTDETSSPASYVLLTSGTLGSTMTTTALASGTAARVRCVINAGVGPTGDPDPEGTRAEAKFYVAPEVLCADEFNDADRISSLTHGAVTPVNAALRGGLSSTPSFTTVESGAFLSTGTEATAGLLRGTNNSVLVAARNAANTQNIDIVSTDASDNIIIGEGTDATSIAATVKAGGFFRVLAGSTELGRIGGTFVQVGNPLAAIAQSGVIRIASAGTIAGRNAADSADVNLLTLSSDAITVGDSADAASITEDVKTSGFWRFNIAGTEYLTVENNGSSQPRISTTRTALQIRGPYLLLDSTAGDIILSPAAGNVYLKGPAGATKVLPQDDGVTFFDANLGSFGGGVGVIKIKNATSATTGGVAGFGILYADAGAGKWRGSSGTVTTFGPAEPHCPVCGSDFMTEHESPTYGYLSVCLKCLADELGERAWIRRSRA